ncbi:Phage portal protein, SPP1 Gp6-like [Bifidobacterium margollesii]|uniref:Phage portal protein, SPP1 Gp6-like n=1 Tax=Bifidobacterium margollesii TaxID=2020964 RepID=A0A2N5JBJ9_9BIFI|nr:phage portal protein [Bifidobacterium margollesii]PLS31561.1 Phage portal protein, SPP1 Gp6-like [Bifidobacterium margollesii]
MSEPIPQLESVSVDGLPDRWRADWQVMLAQWRRKLSRNRLRSAYYNGRNRIKNLDIAVPDSMIDFEEVVGWPAKAVDVLANRVRFDGFVTTGDDTDPLGLDALLDASDFTMILPQAVRSSLIHSCSFVNVSGGGGEPVSVFFRSALYETGIWDDAMHSLRCALAIVALTDDSVDTGMARPRELVLYEPDETLRIRLTDGRYTVVERTPNTLGHVPVYVLAYHQDLHRSFGRSRVNREVMSLTDTAVRTMLRMEVSAEFYSWPQRALLGADEPPADKDGNPLTGWQASMSKMLAIGRDADGQLPTIQQFAQMSMQPHTDMLRALAGRFSGATGVPMAQLGVMTDSGPSSAEAIAAAETELVIEARNTCDAFGSQLRRAAQDMAVLNGVSPGDEALRHLKVNWRNPERPSQAAMADAVLKQVQAIPWLANSRVILEQLGYTDTDITRLLSDKNRQNAAAVLDRLVNMNAVDQPANRAVTGSAADAASQPVEEQTPR